MRIMLVLGPIILGAWAGMALHKSIAESMGTRLSGDAPSQPATTASDSTVVVSCPRCQQQLRVPTLASTIVVTCKGYGHKFDHPVG